MLINYLRKVERINILIIMTFGVAIIISIIKMSLGESRIYMLLNLVISLVILLVMNHFLKHEPIAHRSPIYYYTFLTLTTITVYLDGGHTSDLFPAIFILPILYTSINFSRKGSTSISIFTVLIILFTILQDSTLAKLDQALVISIFIIAMPHFIGLLVKEYVSNMKKLIKINKVPFNVDK